LWQQVREICSTRQQSGTLAAAVALLARDRKGMKLAFQQILYSPLDDRQNTPSSEEITDPRVLNRDLLLTIWKDYLGRDSKLLVNLIIVADAEAEKGNAPLIDAFPFVYFSQIGFV
jgi:acetyl esterase/lipase